MHGWLISKRLHILIASGLQQLLAALKNISVLEKNQEKNCKKIRQTITETPPLGLSKSSPY